MLPPERRRRGTLDVGVAPGFSLETRAGSSSGGGGEGATRVVCNDEGGSSVRWLHDGGHEMSGPKVPMRVQRDGIAIQIEWANVANLARSCWTSPTKEAL